MIELRNIKITIEYDGTRYSGWQKQKNAEGIQDMVTNAIRQVTGETVKLNASGRTDAGVHRGKFRVDLPTRSYMAVRLEAIEK